MTTGSFDGDVSMNSTEIAALRAWLQPLRGEWFADDQWSSWVGSTVTEVNQPIPEVGFGLESDDDGSVWGATGGDMFDPTPVEADDRPTHEAPETDDLGDNPIDPW